MLYKLNEKANKSSYKKVKRVNFKEIDWNEKDLENLIANNIRDFISINDLMTIFVERPWKEEPDILALDSKGDLYIFELKRWEAKQENLLQVLRYGQLYGKSNYDHLNEIYKKYNMNEETSLIKDHSSYFETNLREEDFNRNQHFLVITNGLDQETVESISYWKSNGLNIDAIVYWVFEINKEHYIEFNMYSQNENFLEYESNCYIVNTNKKSNEKYTDEMLNEKKVAAYYPGWREKIEKLQKGDTVFLYENGKGIIAYGLADGKLNKCSCDDNADFEYNMKLEEFKKLDNPITASEMKKITNRGFNFRQTMFSIPEEVAKELIDKINDK